MQALAATALSELLPRYRSGIEALERKASPAEQPKLQRYRERLASLEATQAVRPDNARDVYFDLMEQVPEIGAEIEKLLQGTPMAPVYRAEQEAYRSSAARASALKSAALIGAGITLTALTGGLAGPVVALTFGFLFGAGTSGHQLWQAQRALVQARDDRDVGAASEAWVEYRANERLAAAGGVAINLATAGVATRLGVGPVAGRTLAQAVLGQAAKGAALGFGAGAAQASINPNVWRGERPGTLILEQASSAALLGGAGAAAGLAVRASRAARLNLFGEGEAPRFRDVSTRGPWSQGRALTETIPSGSAREILIRNAPLTEAGLQEIERLAAPGARITLSQPADGSQAAKLTGWFQGRAKLLSDRTISSNYRGPMDGSKGQRGLMVRVVQLRLDSKR